MRQTISDAPPTESPFAGQSPAKGPNNIEQLLHQASPAEAKILRSLLAVQKRHELFAPESQVLVAVSGGADSLCLIHALGQLAPHWRLSLHVAHLDHALRPDSAADAAYVATLAQQWNFPFYSSRLTPGILDDAAGGLEDAARSARYRFLRQVAERISTSKNAPVTVATAHQQEDQAETLLMHLIQGSGLTGLAGMEWVGEVLGGRTPVIRLVRPFLAVSRGAIHDYLRTIGLSWREDSSNADLAHLRNQLRHRVLPLLAEINPNINETLARTSELLRVEANHATERDRAALAAIGSITGGDKHQTRLALDLFQLAQVDEATQRGVLRQGLLALGIDLRSVGMEGIDSLLEAARQAKTGGPHPLVAGWDWTIFQHSGGAFLSLHLAGTLPYAVNHPHFATPLLQPLLIPRLGTLTQADLSGGWQLDSMLLKPDELKQDWQSGNDPWRLFCDADCCGDLYLTTVQAGMTMAPLGMAGHRRSLGDILTDRKVPPSLRVGWPVVVAEDANRSTEVVWLCGLVVSETIRVQSTTHQVRQLQWAKAATSDQEHLNQVVQS